MIIEFIITKTKKLSKIPLVTDEHLPVTLAPGDQTIPFFGLCLYTHTQLKNNNKKQHNDF